LQGLFLQLSNMDVIINPTLNIYLFYIKEFIILQSN